MKLGQEIFAVIMLLAAFIFNREVEGGAGTEKEAKVVSDVMAYLQSPGGLHVTSPRALDVWRFALPVFIKALVLLLNATGVLGNSASSPKPSAT